MKNPVLLCAVVCMMLTSCSKKMETVPKEKTAETQNGFVRYSILPGHQYCENNLFTSANYAELKFVVKFDSSAIYKTISSSNQVDINKLYGFSDNNAQHHQFSARFGWRWSNNALRLFAYVYNDGVVSLKELGTIAIGAEINCSIKVAGPNYVFTMGDKMETMPRTSVTEQAVGYKLYPYFGGDEVAPHLITIWIKEIN